LVLTSVPVIIIHNPGPLVVEIATALSPEPSSGHVLCRRALVGAGVSPYKKLWIHHVSKRNFIASWEGFGLRKMSSLQVSSGNFCRISYGWASCL